MLQTPSREGRGILARNLMRDEQRALFAPSVIETGPKSGRPPKDRRLVLGGVFRIARIGPPWRDLPESFGPPGRQSAASSDDGRQQGSGA